MEAKSLITKLSKFYWSPAPPESYTLKGTDGKRRGIGNIAHHDYGAFNLAWADVQNRWRSMEEQTIFVAKFAEWRTVTGILVDKYPLGEWATLYTPTEFKLFLGSAEIKVKTKLLLIGVVEKAIQLGASHGVS